MKPWSYFVALIDDKSTQDADIQTKTMTLINRVRKQKERERS